MSTFTEFNGPQGGGLPVAQITKLIDAYSGLSTKLNEHISNSVNSEAAKSKVHGVLDYVDGIKNKLETSLTNKANSKDLIDTNKAVEELKSLIASVDNEMTQMACSVGSLREKVKNKAEKSAVDSKASAESVNTVNKALAELKKAWDDFSACYSEVKGENNKYLRILFDCSVQAAEYLIGKVQAHKYIDFTQWADVAAQFAGTGIADDDTNTNGLYILGELSFDWSGMGNTAAKPNGFAAYKAGRAYIKYVNSDPFDSIVDFTASYANDKWTGTLTQQTSRSPGSWLNLSYHLIEATDRTGQKRVYLAISADELALSDGNARKPDQDGYYNTNDTGNTAYSNLRFYVSGVNFIPLTDTDRVQGVKKAFCTDNMDSALTQGISANRLIDFVDWVKVDARHVLTTDHDNTGLPVIDAGNEHFALGLLSQTFKDTAEVAETPFVKQGLAYIKHVGDYPFSATVSYTIEKTGDDEWRGTVKADVSRPSGKWRNITFGLEISNDFDNRGKEAYLTISADGLTKTSVDSGQFDIYACGLNFRPLALSNGKIAAETKLFAKCNYDHVIVGTGEENDITFTSLPKVPIKTEAGEVSSSPLASLSDVLRVTLPVGSIIDWPHFEEKTKKQVIEEGLEEAYKKHYGELWDEILDDNEVVSRFAINLPKGFMACDGSAITAAEFPELYLVTGERLPVCDFKAIRVSSYEDNTTQDPVADGVLDTELLNKKIEQEVAARKEADVIEAAARKAADEELAKRIEEESDKSAAADKVLETSIQEEAEAREQADGMLLKKIEEEQAAREEFESSTGGSLTELNKFNEEVNKRIDDEEAAREAADEALGKRIDEEARARERDNTELGKRIDDEAAARKAADTELGERVNREVAAIGGNAARIQELVEEEASLRRKEDASLSARIDEEAAARERADTELGERIDEETAERKSAVAGLNEAVTESERRVSDTLAGEVETIEGNIVAMATELKKRVEDEKSAREASEAEIRESVEQETAKREAADTELGERVDSEAKTRKTYDDALGERIDIETGFRKSADDAFGERLDSEATLRKDMDNMLEERIKREADERKMADEEETASRKTADDKEASARKEADDSVKALSEKTREDMVKIDQRVDRNTADITDQDARLSQLTTRVTNLERQ